MPAEPRPFSKLAEELIGEFRGVAAREPRNMRRRPTRDMAAIVEELAIKYQIGRPSPEEAIRELWSKLVGAALASSSHPVRIDRGRRLVVHVSDSVVREELFFNRALIVERIQKLPGCSGVSELHIRAG
jgi:hypothetical protein